MPEKTEPIDEARKLLDSVMAELREFAVTNPDDPDTLEFGPLEAFRLGGEQGPWGDDAVYVEWGNLRYFLEQYDALADKEAL